MQRIALTLLICLVLAAAEAVELRDAEGRTVRPLVLEDGRKAAVLLFLACDCPISNAYAPEIGRLAKEFAALPFYLVYPDPDVTAGAARQHAAEFKIAATQLLDPQAELARKTGATVTPEAVVVDAAGKVLYRGRIDDRYPELGKQRAEPSRRDLREALLAVLAGKPVAMAETKAVGCFIPEPKKK